MRARDVQAHPGHSFVFCAPQKTRIVSHGKVPFPLALRTQVASVRGRRLRREAPGLPKHVGQKELGSKMMKTMFSAPPEGYWPRTDVVAVLERTYESVFQEDLDDGAWFYRVENNGVRFMVILFHAEGRQESIVQFAFLSYFSGFDLTESGVQALNRNLHISIAELDEKSNLVLVCLMDTQGVFDANRFSLVLEAWRRDMVMTIKMLVPGASLMGSFPAATLERLAPFAVRNEGAGAPTANAAHATAQSTVTPRTSLTGFDADGHMGEAFPRTPNGTLNQPSNLASAMANAHDTTGGRAPNQGFNRKSTGAMLDRFLGVKDASRQLCDVCDGRGKTGFPARACRACDGAGLTRPAPSTRY